MREEWIVFVRLIGPAAGFPAITRSSRLLRHGITSIPRVLGDVVDTRELLLAGVNLGAISLTGANIAVNAGVAIRDIGD
jgi:hypothetical protein